MAFADDLAGRNIEGRKQRGRARKAFTDMLVERKPEGGVAGVVVTAPGGLARPHRQHRLARVERLDLGLLIDTQDDGMLGWRYIETDHVAYFDHEVGVGRKLERLYPMRLQAIHAVLAKTPPPLADRPLVHSQPGRDFLVLAPFRTGQDNPRPQSRCLGRLAVARLCRPQR
jgi:hypothetical protein